MFCPQKNAYLQLVCPVEPRVIGKAVRYALRKQKKRPEDDASDIALPNAKKLESTQPSLSAPCVDVTQARLGFGGVGLRLIIRELNSDNPLVKLQAIHTLLDQFIRIHQDYSANGLQLVHSNFCTQSCARMLLLFIAEVQIPESIYYLINQRVIYRLINLMLNMEPIIREKVAIILSRLATTYQGRKYIMSRPVVVDNLISMFMQDRKEIRYAASLCLKTLTRDRCCCEVIMKNEDIIISLLKMIRHDYMEIVLYHINSLKNLSEWDPVKPLKANAFQVMYNLLIFPMYRVVQAAMDCMAQLCKHDVGKKLADKYDMNEVLTRFLLSPDIEVIVSTVGLMQYTTLTVQSKWRTRQFVYDLVKRLITFALAQSVPVLQLRALQVLVNLCDCADFRSEIKTYWDQVIIRNVKIRPHESFITSEITTFEIKTGYNYETMCIEDLDTIKTDFGNSVEPDDVHSYASRIRAVKQKLIIAMNKTPY